MLIWIPAEEDGFFESAPEAGFLVAQALAGVAVFSGAVDSVAPVQVLAQLMLMAVKRMGFVGI